MAARPAGWPALRAYAAHESDPTLRGYAYFTLGYREYRAGQYAQAAKDLAESARSGFSLRDLAVYYLARADYKGGQVVQAAETLGTFQRQFPESTVLSRAVGLLAWAELQSGQAAKAVATLTGYPKTFERPSLELELLLAYKSVEDWSAAARVAEDIYYASPTAPQAEVARLAMQRLKIRLGANYPPVSNRIQAARARKLFQAGRFRQALKEYQRLLREYPKSSQWWSWKLGEALSLLRLNREDDAVGVLRSGVPLSVAFNAERWRLLVEAYLDLGDEARMNRALDQLRIHDAGSRWYAEALYAVAAYYEEKGNVPLAAALYTTLAKSFPKLSEGETALWRVAWLDYYANQSALARSAFLKYIGRYPTSPRTAGALYFLGRLAETQGDSRRARDFYKLVLRRYRHSYYALASAARLRALARAPRAALNHQKDDRGVFFQELISLVPPRPALPFNACLDASAEPLSRPYLTLASLGLVRLASQSLRGLLRGHHQPDLIFAFSRLEAERGRPDEGIYWMRKLIRHYPDMRFQDLPSSVWALLYPRDDWTLVDREARFYGLDPYLIMGLIREESGFYPEAVSSADAVGLTQILTPLGARRRLENPWYNVHAGCAYLRQLIRRYRGNLTVALAAYNAGPTRVDGWLRIYPFRSPEDFIETIPFPVTRTYVRAVLRDEAVYRRLLTGKARYWACAAQPAG